jgi:hypothetical protein
MSYALGHCTFLWLVQGKQETVIFGTTIKGADIHYRFLQTSLTATVLKSRRNVLMCLNYVDINVFTRATHIELYLPTVRISPSLFWVCLIPEQVRPVGGGSSSVAHLCFGTFAETNSRHAFAIIKIYFRLHTFLQGLKVCLFPDAIYTILIDGCRVRKDSACTACVLRRRYTRLSKFTLNTIQP